MMRHTGTGRTGQPCDGGSSSEEDDVFSALSRKRKGSKESSSVSSLKKQGYLSGGVDRNQDEPKSKEETQPPMKLPVASTSSTKRHHGEVSDARKAKMDALLLELEAEKNRATAVPIRHHANERNQAKGSFVEPGDEHLTTNIFVGNLAPSITEEQMTDLFRQFGDLYSVKIMWPRTVEERSRNRHTGFVCFMHRQDAEDAMDACSEADPFNVGRRLMMRWGKNVKKAADGIPVVRKGTGGIAPMIETKTDIENHRAAAALEALLNVDNQRSIRVVPPQDKQRAHFISTVASFVAKDGEQFERMLIHEELSNTDLKFLALSSDANETTKQENVFYKWRVYSFCQGDGFHTWRTEPFTMFQPNGCSWIPPPLDVEAARKEVEESKRKEEEIRKQKQQRRFQSAKRGLTTGRQLEQARRGAADAGARLTDHELTEFDRLFKQTLCASRESICQAMAFCFEKSGAAKQVASMLNDLLLQTAPGTSAETMTARLYLISDVLFNSQQPGIRNAFMYRDAIERMSPDVFRSMGEFARDNFGRMSRERLASAISAILAAWTNWGVYDPAFLDELQAGFEGREIVAGKVEETANDMIDTDMIDTDMIEPEYKMGHATTDSTNASAITETPIGDWTTVAADLHEPWEDGNLADGDPEVPIDDDTDGEPLDDVQASEALQVHEDGAPLEDADADGEPLDDASVESHSSQIPISTKLLGDANGVPLGDDADGEPLEDGPDDDPFDEDPGSVRDEDGEALDDPDGEPLEEELDGGVLQHD